VLAHVPDPNDFVAGLATLLHEDGIAEVEAPYRKDLIDNLEFDTIYHEHLSYFSVTAAKSLFERHGLSLNHLRHFPIHGGSFRFTLGKKALVSEACVRSPVGGPSSGAHRLRVLPDLRKEGGLAAAAGAWTSSGAARRGE
jgi:hypothetical protein